MPRVLEVYKGRYYIIFDIFFESMQSDGGSKSLQIMKQMN